MSKLAIRGHGFRNVWFDLLAMDNRADIGMSYMEKSYEETIDALLQRNRELTERLEAAERLVEKWRNVETTNRTSQIVYGWAAEELEQAIAPVAPVKPTDDETIRGRCPVAGEERTTT